MARSGVSMWREPSMCDWKRTPSSVILRSLLSDMTWKPPRVGEDRAVPAHEAVQAAEPRDALGAGAQHQVIGVGEHDVGAGGAHLLGVERLDGRRRADRHERGRADDPARRRDLAQARGAALRDQPVAEPGQRVLHSDPSGSNERLHLSRGEVATRRSRCAGEGLRPHSAPPHPAVALARPADLSPGRGESSTLRGRKQQAGVAVGIEAIAAAERVRIGRLHHVEPARRPRPA